MSKRIDPLTLEAEQAALNARRVEHFTVSERQDRCELYRSPFPVSGDHIAKLRAIESGKS